MKKISDKCRKKRVLRIYILKKGIILVRKVLMSSRLSLKTILVLLVILLAFVASGTAFAIDAPGVEAITPGELSYSQPVGMEYTPRLFSPWVIDAKDDKCKKGKKGKKGCDLN